MYQLPSRGILPIVGSIGFLLPRRVSLASSHKYEPLLGFEPVRWLGGMVTFFGTLVVLLDSFARFALQRRGTPTPIYPTAMQVVLGAYR
jgi:hypothetical protein